MAEISFHFRILIFKFDDCFIRTLLSVKGYSILGHQCSPRYPLSVHPFQTSSLQSRSPRSNSPTHQNDRGSVLFHRIPGFQARIPLFDTWIDRGRNRTNFRPLHSRIRRPRCNATSRVYTISRSGRDIRRFHNFRRNCTRPDDPRNPAGRRTARCQECIFLKLQIQQFLFSL